MFEKERKLLADILKTMLDRAKEEGLSEEVAANLADNANTIMNIQSIVLKYRTIIRQVQADFEEEE